MGASSNGVEMEMIVMMMMGVVGSCCLSSARVRVRTPRLGMILECKGLRGLFVTVPALRYCAFDVFVSYGSTVYRGMIPGLRSGRELHSG